MTLLKAEQVWVAVVPGRGCRSRHRIPLVCSRSLEPAWGLEQQQLEWEYVGEGRLGLWMHLSVKERAAFAVWCVLG